MMTFMTSYFFLQAWALIVLGGLLYWLPTIIALFRQSDARPGIALLNFFFGWTFLGWVAALVWASTSAPAYRGSLR
jgi:hypothetical protein